MPRIQELTIVSAQVPEALKQDLQALATRDDRTLSYVIRRALREYVREQQREAA